MDVFIEKSQELMAVFLPKIGGALLLLLIGLFTIKHLRHLLEKALMRARIDATLKPFIVSFTSTSLKILLLYSVVSMIGVQLTSFVAILGASSLAIGLAFQGSLSNFAGGVLLLTLRPFKVGDYISVSGSSGTVEAINVFNTILITPDNTVITIPNGGLANSSVTNYTSKASRRVDFKFGVSYNEDITHIKQVLTTIAHEHSLVLKDPEPFINVFEHADSAIIFVVRVWTKTENYWDVYFQIQEIVHQYFKKENISIPFPQLDVHLNSDK